MNSLLNSYFVKTHKLEISIAIIAIVLFLIYFIGAPHVFTRFPIYRAFMQSMPFFGIIAIDRGGHPLHYQLASTAHHFLSELLSFNIRLFIRVDQNFKNPR